MAISIIYIYKYIYIGCTLDRNGIPSTSRIAADAMRCRWVGGGEPKGREAVHVPRCFLFQGGTARTLRIPSFSHSFWLLPLTLTDFLLRTTSRSVEKYTAVLYDHLSPARNLHDRCKKTDWTG